MAFLPNVPAPEPPQPYDPNGSMWDTIKYAAGQLPSNVSGLDPMPLSYVASAPSFISKLMAAFKGQKALLPEEIKASTDLAKAGMKPLMSRTHASLVDQWGNAWRSPVSHEETLLDAITYKNDWVTKPLLREHLFENEYDLMPKGLGDYKMIRSSGEGPPGFAGFEVPLNATEDSIKGAGDLVKRGDTLYVDYKVPIRGTDSTNNSPFKSFINSSGVPLSKTFDNFNPKQFENYSKNLNNKVLELYPEFQKAMAKQDFHDLAARLDPENPVKYLGSQMGGPMFQQANPGVGSFMMQPGETIEQAFQRARTRYLTQK